MPGGLEGFDNTKRFILQKLLPATEACFGSRTVCTEVQVLPDDEISAVALVRGPSWTEMAFNQEHGLQSECQMEVSRSAAEPIEEALMAGPSRPVDLNRLRVSLYVLVHEAIESMDVRGADEWSRNSYATHEAGLNLFCEGLTNLAAMRFQDQILSNTGLPQWSELRDVKLTHGGYLLEQSASDIVFSGLCMVGGIAEDEGVRILVRENPGVDSLRNFIRRVSVPGERIDRIVDDVLQTIVTDLNDESFRRQSLKMEKEAAPGFLSRVLGRRPGVIDARRTGLDMGAGTWKQIKPILAGEPSLQ